MPIDWRRDLIIAVAGNLLWALLAWLGARVYLHLRRLPAFGGYMALGTLIGVGGFAFGWWFMAPIGREVFLSHFYLRRAAVGLFFAGAGGFVLTAFLENIKLENWRGQLVLPMYLAWIAMAIVMATGAIVELLLPGDQLGM